MPQPLPELALDASLRERLDGWRNGFTTLDAAEASVLSAPEGSMSDSALTSSFIHSLRELISRRGYAVVRGLTNDGGFSVIALAQAVGGSFATYAPGKIVKRFKMSPWTRELSHTLAGGNFHTDGNVSEVPPVATAIQCEEDDPGGDCYATMRVAHLPELLAHLQASGSAGKEAVSFLTAEQIPMAHARSNRVWSGELIKDQAIRYHPESLRTAAARLGGDVERVERVIGTVHEAAVAVSVPFRLRPGDALVVSNSRALHYRGECSVRFRKFPTEFDARSILVLHRDGADV